MKMDPLYWVGSHAVILDDVTDYGLVRRHIVRHGRIPDVAQFTRTAPKNADYQLYMGADGYGHLWIYWKDPSKAKKVTDWTALLAFVKSREPV